MLPKFPFPSSKHVRCAGEQGGRGAQGGRSGSRDVVWGEGWGCGGEEGEGRGEGRESGRETGRGRDVYVPVSEEVAVASCRRMLTAAVEARVRAASCPNPKKLCVYSGSCRFGSFSSCTLSAALVGTSGQKVTCNVAAHGLKA